jgi:hypothetical protein
MNILQESQVSGIEWHPIRPTLHQPGQLISRVHEVSQRLMILGDFERQMADFQVQHEAVVRDVQRKFVLPADTSVEDFLKEHRTLPQILLESVSPLKIAFGAQIIVSLRVPVDEWGARTLYAVAMWRDHARDAREALAKFDDSWWIANSQQASGRLVYTYELV